MSENYSIRLMTNEDLPAVLSWRNHPDVRRFMFTQHVIELDEHRAWFASASHELTRRLLIVEHRSQAIGYAQFNNVVAGGVADWGFYNRPDAPKGSGRKLGQAALTYAFDVLHLHKVCGQAIESNLASIAFHKRLGFSQEGVLREQQSIDGVHHTLICFGLLNYEWRPEHDFKDNTDAQD